MTDKFDSGTTPTDHPIASAIRSVDAVAPASLHASINQMAGGRSRSQRSLVQRTATLGAALAVLLLVLIFHNGTPDVTKTLAFNDPSAASAAPKSNPAKPDELLRDVGGVNFPDWDHSLGWHATGSRQDELDGRTVSTVFYAGPDRGKVAYSIVGGKPLDSTSGTEVVRDHSDYLLFKHGGLTAVTWRRAGRTCVISAKGVSGDTLLRLASYDGASPGTDSAS